MFSETANHQLHWIGLKKNGITIVPMLDHNQLTPLQFLINYTNIVLVLVVAHVLHDFKLSTMVYMILNAKRSTGCGLHGYSFVSVPFF